jgi:hypothetical protein
VKVVKRGSVIAYDNPGFDSPAVGKIIIVSLKKSAPTVNKLYYKRLIYQRFSTP